MAQRNANQKALDRTFIANLLLRSPHLRLEEMLRELQANRTYQVTLANVKSDLAALREGLDLSPSAIEYYRTNELNQINMRQAFCWAVFSGDASRTEDGNFEFLGVKMPKRKAETVVKSFEWILDEDGNAKPVPSTSQSRVEMLRGNAEWLRSCLAECSRSRRDLLGLDAPKRSEVAMSGDAALPELPPHLQAIIEKEYGTE